MPRGKEKAESGVTASWIQGFLWGCEMFGIYTEVVVAKHCKCTKCHWIVTLLNINSMLYELMNFTPVKKSNALLIASKDI